MFFPDTPKISIRQSHVIFIQFIFNEWKCLNKIHVFICLKCDFSPRVVVMVRWSFFLERWQTLADYQLSINFNKFLTCIRRCQFHRYWYIYCIWRMTFDRRHIVVLTDDIFVCCWKEPFVRFAYFRWSIIDCFKIRLFVQIVSLCSSKDKILWSIQTSIQSKRFLDHY